MHALLFQARSKDKLWHWGEILLETTNLCLGGVHLYCVKKLDPLWLDLRKPSLSAQEMKSNLLLIIKPTLLHYLKIPSTYVAIDDQVCFHWRLIADPVKPPWCNTGSVGPVGGTNKDVTGARLLPTTVSTCPVDWVPFCHSLKTQHCCLCPYGSFNLPQATHLPPPPTPPTPYNMPFLILQSLWKKLLKNQQC